MTSGTAGPPQNPYEFSYVQIIARHLRPVIVAASCWERVTSVVASRLACKVILEARWPIHLVEMKKPRISTPPQPREAVKLPSPVFGIIAGLVGLFMMAIALFAEQLPANPNVPQPGRSSAVGMVGYVRSGQLAADARTACSMVQWLLDPEPDLVPTLSLAGPAPIISSLRTNNSTPHTVRN